MAHFRVDKHTAQEALRQELIQYLDETGTKACIIAKRIDVPDAIISQFKNGKRSLYSESYEALKHYLMVSKGNTVNCVINVTKKFLN